MQPREGPISLRFNIARCLLSGTSFWSGIRSSFDFYTSPRGKLTSQIETKIKSVSTFTKLTIFLNFGREWSVEFKDKNSIHAMAKEFDKASRWNITGVNNHLHVRYTAVCQYATMCPNSWPKVIDLLFYSRYVLKVIFNLESWIKLWNEFILNVIIILNMSITIMWL